MKRALVLGLALSVATWTTGCASLASSAWQQDDGGGSFPAGDYYGGRPDSPSSGSSPLSRQSEPNTSGRDCDNDRPAPPSVTTEPRTNDSSSEGEGA